MNGDPTQEVMKSLENVEYPPDSNGPHLHRRRHGDLLQLFCLRSGRMLIQLSDDVGAASCAEVWDARLEKFTLAWLANSGTSCNYHWASFQSMPCYWDDDFANTTTDIETISDALAEITNGGTYGCSAGFAEGGSGGVVDHVQMVCALADQAGAGSLYDPWTLDTLTGLRSSSPTLKYAIKTAA